MNIRNILTVGALVAALVVPSLGEAQTVIRKYPHRTVIVRRPHHAYHRHAIVVRRPYRRHGRTVIFHPRRTVIVHH